MNKMEIIKTTAEKYELKERGWYTNFYVEANGTLNINSSWGDWSYRWHSPGEEFKKFLCGLDIHYLAGKMKEGNTLDEVATIRLWKEFAKETLDRQEMEQKHYETIMTEIQEVEENFTPSSFKVLAYRQPLLSAMFDHQIEFEVGVSQRFRTFFEKAWKPFVETLKADTVD